MAQPPAYTIRPAERRDLPALGRLGAALLRTHYAFDPLRFIEPGDDPEGGYAWFLGTQLDDEEVVVLVAEMDGAVVGYAYAGIEPHSWKELRARAGFVHDVLVDPSARGRGIAHALMEEAVGWMRSQGVPRVLLWTATQNAAARRLFERLGFRATMVEMTREL